MKYPLLCFLLLCCFGRLSAQNQKSLDSLNYLAENTKDERLRLKLLGDLCWGYGTIDFDKALSYGQSALSLAEKLGDSTSIALAYSDLGNTYLRVNKLKEALNNHLKALQLRERLGLKTQAAGSISNISVIYKQLGNFEEALTYMYRSLKIYEESNESAKQALVLCNIGNVYMSYSKYNPARDSYLKALSIARKINAQPTMANAYSGLFNYYYKQLQYKQALNYALQAHQILQQLNQKSDLASVKNNIGKVYSDLKDYPKALEYYKSALSTRIDMDDKIGIASCYMNMGEAYTGLKDYERAERYLRQSIDVFRAEGAKDYLRDALHKLARLYERNEKFEHALESFKGSTALKDSIYSKEVMQKINELQIAYETEKKAQQIVVLNKENNIQKLKLANRNILLAAATGLLMLSIVLMIAIFKGLRLRQKSNLQKEIIKQQDMATKAVLSAEENERKRISAELHDGLGQMFSAVKMNLSAIAGDIEFKDEESGETYQKTLTLVDESCREVRAISHQMAPNILLKSGLATAVRDFINKIDSRKLKINLETVGLGERLDQNIETVLYRVIQEVVNNVIKHAEADTLDIQLVRDEEGIQVMIEDNGKGFDMTALENMEGHGLKNIQTRVAYLKGHVDFSSGLSKGTLVAIYIPL